MSRTNKKIVLFMGVGIFLGVFLSLYAQENRVMRISVRDYPNFSRFMVTSSLPFSYEVEREDSSLLIVIETNISFRIRRERFTSRFVDSFSWEERNGKIVLHIKPKHGDYRYDHFTLSNPFQIVIDLTPLAAGGEKPDQDIEQGKEKAEKT